MINHFDEAIFWVITSLLIGLILSLGSCTSEKCEEETEAYLNMTIQVTDSEAGTKPDSITIWGVGHEADLLYDTATVSIVKLPLDPSSGQVDFVIRRGSEEDLLTIKYRSEGRFISKPCGYGFIYFITEVNHTTSRIENILIINDEVNPGDEENLRTFY
ncbi:MAG: DUF6452 family protein [Bacteroidales bacterium]